MRITSAVPLLGAAATSVVAQSQAGPYGQCGGVGWTGPVACQTGYYCYEYKSVLSIPLI